MVTDAERKAQEERERKQREEAQRAQASTPPKPAGPPPTSPPLKPATSSGTSGSRGVTAGVAIGRSLDERIESAERELETLKKKRDAQIDPNEYAGELAHGELGFITLDEEGHPQGVATKEPPAFGTLAARVVGYNPTMDPIVTPSGAPITDTMNPNPDFRDVGLDTRNPPPEGMKLDPKNSPVVNTPVRY